MKSRQSKRKPAHQHSPQVPPISCVPEKQTSGQMDGHLAQSARLFADEIVATVREPLLLLDANLRVEFANRSFYTTFQVSPNATVTHLIFDLGNGQWDIPALRTLLEAILVHDHVFEDFEVTHVFPSIGQRTMLLNARKLRQPGDHPERILLAIEDITERKRIEEAQLEQASWSAGASR